MIIVLEKVNAIAIYIATIVGKPKTILIKNPITEVNITCPIPVINETFPTPFIMLGFISVWKIIRKHCPF